MQNPFKVLLTQCLHSKKFVRFEQCSLASIKRTQLSVIPILPVFLVTVAYSSQQFNNLTFQCVQESLMMIPDCHRRLEKSYDVLKGLVITSIYNILKWGSEILKLFEIGTFYRDFKWSGYQRVGL